MHSKQRTKTFIFSLSLVLAFAGCVKKRPAMEGQGENLQDLVSIHGLTSVPCKIMTTDIRQHVFASQAKSTSIETSGRHGIKNVDLVNFETNCPYLGSSLKNIELMAAPHSEISAHFEVNASTIVLYKIVARDELSHLESPFAIQEGDHFKVPVGGFEISGFYNVESERNADNRETNVQRKISVSADNYRKAEYLTFNRDAFKNFTHLPKQDVYPKEYFQGEWYYAATVVNVRHNTGDHPGRLLEEDSARKRASRVRFRIDGKYIVAENQNVDERLRDKKHDLNMDSTLQIPIKNVDYRARPQGAGMGLEEEAIATKLPNEARYIEMRLDETEIVDPDFDSPMNSFFAILRSKSDKSKIVNELVIRDDYFSFLLENREHDEVIRYAFMRVKPSEKPTVQDFQPRVAFKSDMDRFGFFTTRQDQIYDIKLRTQQDVEAITYLERYHPQKDIVYHFSKSTPKEKWIRDIGREAVAIWDQALQKAGLKIHMRVDETEDVELGDLRYNVLNFVGDLTGALIGYGPVIADSKSGEILSGTTNLFIENYKQVNASQMRIYVAEKIGQRFRINEPGNLAQPLNHLNPGLTAMLGGHWIREPEQGLHFASIYRWKMGDSSPYKRQNLFSETEVRTNSNGRWSSPNELLEAFLSDVRAGKMTRALSRQMDQTAPLSHWALEKFIETSAQCQPVRSLIARYTTSGVPTTEEFLTAVESCVIPFTQIEGLAATVHEIGHNMGLLHNFMGSRDKKNFASADEYKLSWIEIPKELSVPRSSSIMDYFSGEAGFQVYPGPYDIAAIRFGYKDQVESSSGTFVTFNTSQELDRQVDRGGLHPFMYCSDIHRYFRSDVFCKAHDVGTTATEGAISRVSDLYRSLSSIYRYQTAYELWDWDMMNYYWLSALYDFKTYYDQWRLLVAQEVGERKAYLQGISTDEYAQIIDRMLKSDRKEEVEDFLRARNVIVQSLIDFVFLSNRYCVVLNEGKDKSFIELSSIRKELQRLSVYGRIDSCDHPAVLSHLAGQKLKYVEQVGFDLEPGSYETSPINGMMAYDYMGTIPIRLNAALLLTVHGTVSEVNSLQDFFPSMMDEPDIRGVVVELWRYRILKGNFIPVRPKDFAAYAQARLLNVNDQMARTYNNQGRAELQVNYAAEANLLQALSDHVALAHYVPGDVPETIQRIRRFQVEVFPTRETEFYKSSFQLKYELDKKISLGVSEAPDQSIAAEMIQSLDKLAKKKTVIAMTPETFMSKADGLVEALNRRHLLPPQNEPTNYDFCRLNRVLTENVAAAQATGQDANEAVIDHLFDTEKSAAKDVMKQMEAELGMQGFSPKILDIALKAHEVFENAMSTLGKPDDRDKQAALTSEVREKALDILAEKVRQKQLTTEEAQVLFRKLNPEEGTVDAIADGALDLLADATQNQKITVEQARVIAKRIMQDAKDRSKPKPGEPFTPIVPANKTTHEGIKRAFAVLDQSGMPVQYAGQPGLFPTVENLHKRAESLAKKIGAKRSEMNRNMGEYAAHWNLITKVLLDFTAISL